MAARGCWCCGWALASVATPLPSPLQGMRAAVTGRGGFQRLLRIGRMRYLGAGRLSAGAGFFVRRLAGVGGGVWAG